MGLKLDHVPAVAQVDDTTPFRTKPALHVNVARSAAMVTAPFVGFDCAAHAGKDVHVFHFMNIR